jgi:hypothetical protein
LNISFSINALIMADEELAVYQFYGGLASPGTQLKIIE